MAIPLRRGIISARKLIFLKPTFRCSEISYISSSNSNQSNVISETSLFGIHHLESSNQLGLDYLKECRRGFAKGKKSKNSDNGSAAEVVDIGPSLKANTSALMEAAQVALSKELSQLRTNRASTGLVDHLLIETSSGKISLNRVCAVSVLDAQTISISPFYCFAVFAFLLALRLVRELGVANRSLTLMKPVENALRESPLGINPKVDGDRLIVPIPPMTKETMQAMCKVVAKAGEDVKLSIRRARQKAIDTIKQASSSMPKDDLKRLEKEIDEMNKKYSKSTEDMCKAKEKEINSPS
ncbi:hypothetical protein C5167_050133 [Papaver somniferum]|uniref:Ribosome-recycling factor, chloroplastic n=1 Tax=Papaver somniferum TaxID=3469 RepID=A0A4Y7KMS8_PAPSO|nr:hypothetical protein C5167_050133 [Papaver somniferum]